MTTPHTYISQQPSLPTRRTSDLVLDTDEFGKLLTNEEIQKLNRQIAVAQSMELNYANIKMLLTAIYANKDDMLIDSIVSIFKKITRYHMNEYSTNIHYYNGWKTNDAYRIRSEEHTSELQSRGHIV